MTIIISVEFQGEAFGPRKAERRTLLWVKEGDRMRPMNVCAEFLVTLYGLEDLVGLFCLELRHDLRCLKALRLISVIWSFADGLKEDTVKDRSKKGLHKPLRRREHGAPSRDRLTRPEGLERRFGGTSR